MESRFRALPSVERLVQQLVGAASPAPRHLVANAVRETLASARQRMVDGDVAPEPGALADEARERLDRALRASLRTVINATGVVLHTNLGRAPILDAAAEAMAAVATSYSNLEFDLASGERGSRTVHLRSLLRELTGAEDGLAVNNNAGALLHALTALASGREVIVSRGQAVEIGGGFRIPDVLRQSGATLVEVGTTNRTYARDYAAAIGPQTALLMRIHTSNFKLIGFVHETPLEELAAV